MRAGERVCWLVVLAVAAGGACDTGAEGDPGASATSAATGGGGGASSTTGAAGAGGAPDASSTAASGGGGSAGGGILRPCQNHIYACGDAIDNDGDGLVDADDPSCWGACHNSETYYAQQIPDGPFGCSRDCYFDQDSGSGNDACFHDFKCDPHEVPPDYFPNTNWGASCAYDPQANVPGTLLSCAELSAAQSDACLGYCRPLAPNGCDCFGCCDLPSGSGNFVWLGSLDDDGAPSCDVSGALDPVKCHPCEPVPSCLNPCESCELCLGDAGLAPGCTAPSCAGAAPCGVPGLEPCAEGLYCVTGCCQPTAP